MSTNFYNFLGEWTRKKKFCKKEKITCMNGCNVPI